MIMMLQIDYDQFSKLVPNFTNSNWSESNIFYLLYINKKLNKFFIISEEKNWKTKKNILFHRICKLMKNLF